MKNLTYPFEFKLLILEAGSQNTRGLVKKVNKKTFTNDNFTKRDQHITLLKMDDTTKTLMFV